MTRQVGKAWGDFRRFREHLEDEVKGALGEDLVQPYRGPWDVVGSSEGTPDGAAPDGATPADGSASGEATRDRAPPEHPGQLAPLPPATGSAPPAAPGAWDPGLVPDDPSLN